MNKNVLTTLVLASILFYTGCGLMSYIGPVTGDTVDIYRYRREKYVANHPELDEVTKSRVIAGQTWIGMSKVAFIGVHGSGWFDINKTVTAYGTSEQWVCGRNYYYFDNDVLTAWQN